VARIHYLLGSVAFRERQPEAGMQSYKEAIRLDPGYRGDPTLAENLELSLEDKRVGSAALDFLSREVGAPACPTLARVASTDRRPELRHAAWSACETLGCREVDRVQSLLLDLTQAKRCDERREAVLSLKALGDRRALEPLKKARRKGGGFLGLFGGGNECMKKELEEAISSLEKK
jgi:hypothetical protein